MRQVAVSWVFVMMALSAQPVAAAANSSGDETVRLAKQWNDSADADMARGSYAEARRLYLRSLPLLEQALGSEHPASINTLANLCVASSHVSTYLDAKAVCGRALAAREKALGPNHPDVARSLSDLAVLYAGEGDFQRSERLLGRALRITRSLPDSPDLP